MIKPLFALLALSVIACNKPVPTTLQGRYQSVRESIYIVTNQLGSGGGTGFKTHAADGSKVIVTNSHVCQSVRTKAGYVYVRHEDAKEAAQGLIIRDDARVDLCVIQVGNDDGHAPLELGSRSPLVGAYVWTQGHGALRRQRPREGISQGADSVELTSNSIKCNGPGERIITEDTWLGPVQTCVVSFDATALAMDVIGGCSGSPLFDEENKIVGVIFAGSTQGAGSFAVPMESLLRTLGFL